MEVVSERPLDNDDHMPTIQLESEFIRNFNLEKLNKRALVSGKYHTIVHSRSQNAFYGVSSESNPKSISIGDLEDYFSRSGHTLTIDTTKSYAFVCALDLDCVACKTSPEDATNHNDDSIPIREHLNESAAERIRLFLEQYLTTLFLVSDKKRFKGRQRKTWNYKEPIRAILFKREKGQDRCGFHIYTNVQLSSPCNAKVRSRMISFVNETHIHAVIDSPTLMPLPYSAKKPEEPYIPYLHLHNNMTVRMTKILSGKEFFDNCRYLSEEKYKNVDNGEKVVALIKSTPSDPANNRYVILSDAFCKRKSMLVFPKMPRMKRNQLDDNGDESLNQLCTFLNTVREMTSEIQNKAPTTNSLHLKKWRYPDTDRVSEGPISKRARIQSGTNDERGVPNPKLFHKASFETTDSDVYSSISKPDKVDNEGVLCENSNDIKSLLDTNDIQDLRDLPRFDFNGSDQINTRLQLKYTEINHVRDAGNILNKHALGINNEESNKVDNLIKLSYHDKRAIDNRELVGVNIVDDTCNHYAVPESRNCECAIDNNEHLMNIDDGEADNNFSITSDMSQDSFSINHITHEDSDTDSAFLNDFLRKNNIYLCKFKKVFDLTHDNSTLSNQERETDDGVYAELMISEETVDFSSVSHVGNMQDTDPLGMLESMTPYNTSVDLSSSSSSLSTMDFNEIFSLDGLRKFINISAKKCGGMNLQHYLVALRKSLRAEESTRFKRFVNLMYSEFKCTESIKRLLEMFSSVTVDCYSDSYEYILEYLGLVYKYEFGLRETVEDRIEKVTVQLLNISLGTAFTNSANLEEHIQTSGKSNSKSLQWRILISYIQALSQMRILIMDRSIWYIYKEQGFYEKCEPSKYLPWISRFVPHIQASKIVESKASTHFKISQMWSQSNFMFATNVGVFNAITGLYSTNTTLLRFFKERNYALWDPLKTNYVPFKYQNEIILKMHKRASEIGDIFHRKTREIYLHFQVIPAILDLSYVYNIADSNTLAFINIVDTYKDLRPFAFIVNYFCIEPKFIYLMAVLYERDILFFKSYEEAVRCRFGPGRGLLSTQEWREHFKTLLEEVKYDTTAGDHMNKLKSLSSTEYPLGEFTSDYLIYCTIFAVCIIKNWPTYKPFLEAIVPEYADGDLSLHLDHSVIPSMHAKAIDNDAHINQKVLLTNTIEFVFGKNLSPFDQTLIEVGLVLCMSLNFNESLLQELLMAVSFVFTAGNTLKKMIIFFGEKDTGKTLVCNLIQAMCLPSVARVPDIQEPNARANISARYGLVIVIEAKKIDANTLKAITGNETESCKMFFKQEYELLPAEAFFVGATNDFISFRITADPSTWADRITVDRLHTIIFRGIQIQPNDTVHRTDSIFLNTIEGKYPDGSFLINKSEMGGALALLSFAAYFKNRDAKFRPILDVAHKDVLDYQQQVHLINNPLYNFIFECGIMEAKGFTIDTEKFLSKIKVGIDEKSTTVTSLKQFRSLFRLHYKRSLNPKSLLEGFQDKDFVEWVREDMKVEREIGSVIDKETLEKRLESYGDLFQRENARYYFKRTHKPYFDKKKQAFYNIRFVYQNSGPYDGNRIFINNHSVLAPSGELRGTATNSKTDCASGYRNEDISLSSNVSSYTVNPTP